jgi:hypothetical protein
MTQDENELIEDLLFAKEEALEEIKKLRDDEEETESNHEDRIRFLVREVKRIEQEVGDIRDPNRKMFRWVD